MYEEIVNKYYSAILSYCVANLNHDIHAAEDCTQEVFLLLYTKLKRLNLTVNIEGWLYAVADRKMKEYRRKNPNMMDIDEVPEQCTEPEYTSSTENILDVLSQEEYQLLQSYYSGADRAVIAEQAGLSLNALYIRISRIKEKLRDIQAKCTNSND
ncbi:MAG: sigma-70 family RNA polymerase sigma factor [Oscillospiraceae bacterium]